MIEVKNLVKRYGDHYAVDHLSFTVEDGHVFGFLGPNGAGKSTTMNIMTGYLAATEGQVLIDGHDILDEPEAAKARIGYLPEIPPLYGDMTAKEYLRFCGRLKRIPKGELEDQLQRVLTLTHLEDMADRLIRNLSKGYRQRVGLGQAILGFPGTIILDEPTVGLDPKQVVEIRDLIRQLAKDHTVILSSHILSEIRAVCDQVLIIRKGKLVACDTPEALEGTLSAGGAPGAGGPGGRGPGGGGAGDGARHHRLRRAQPCGRHRPAVGVLGPGRAGGGVLRPGRRPVSHPGDAAPDRLPRGGLPGPDRRGRRRGGQGRGGAVRRRRAARAGGRGDERGGRP